MIMEPKFFLFYVEDIDTSVAFYTDLLGITPQRPSPVFASFHLPSGVYFELKTRASASPAIGAAAGTVDICFAAGTREDVEQQCAGWRERGMRIALAPTDEVYGYTFVALDPDGHRLRVIFDPNGSAA